MLEKPDWLFLDEATSALDEELEAEIYRILIEALPKTTIVSIGHRSTLIGLHRHRFEMMRREGGAFEPIPTIGAGIFGGLQPGISANVRRSPRRQGGRVLRIPVNEAG